MTTASYRRQISIVQNLEVSSEPNRYEVVEYRVEEVCKYAFVTRVLRDKQHSSLSQHQCFKVGQRGSVEVIYDRLSTYGG